MKLFWLKTNKHRYELVFGFTCLQLSSRVRMKVESIMFVFYPTIYGYILVLLKYLEVNV